MTVRDFGRKLIGKPPNHWLYDVPASTFDLTRPPSPNFPIPSPESTVLITTSSKTTLVSPSKTALVIIDMQNYFLSPYLDRPVDSAGIKAAQKLLETAIPAARKAGIQIIWLNWGLTEVDLVTMPANTLRGFGLEASLSYKRSNGGTPSLNSHKKNEASVEKGKGKKNSGRLDKMTHGQKSKRVFKGLGSEIGPVEIEDGKIIDGGRLLVRDTWNAALLPPLEAVYEKGQLLKEKPDIWIHKNRTSGLWGGTTPCTDYLEKEEIKTLLFAGVNTDQCVAGSLQDAFTKGWDCILLKDACGTSSPEFATEGVEYNCEKNWGFVTDCLAFERGVQKMLDARSSLRGDYEG